MLSLKNEKESQFHASNVIMVCKKCSDFTGSGEVDEKVILNGDVSEKIAKFLYLKDVLIYEGVQKAVIAGIRSV